ncbi:MAG: hypothetical protein PWP27_2704 [Clostridiales bacterium]|nr:hypothetical protein [Clostridiales bacterium]
MEKLIMTPGPTEVNEKVRHALSQPILNPDLDDDFFAFYKALTQKIQKLLHTKKQVLILNGEGILGLEAACASLIEKGDRVLCLNNGIFGEGFGDFVKMYGGDVIFFREDFNKPFSPEALEAFLKKDSNFKLATLVHCETPSGLINPIEKICPVLKKYGILTVVDAVSSIGGYNIETDLWDIDILLGGSQKCLSAPPGLTFMSISNDAWNIMDNRKTPIIGYYTNLTLWKHWYTKKYFPYTQPVSDLYGLEAAVDIILEEGPSFAARHQALADKARKTLKIAGFEIYPVSEGASNTVTTFMIPDKIEDEPFRKHLWEKYGVMIAGSWGILAGKVWRIGHMGENCSDEKIYRTFTA